MNLVKVAEAVQTRLKADTGTGGLYNVASPLITASHFCDASDSATYPYVVFSIEAANQSPTLLGSEVYECFIDFHIYSDKASGYAVCSSIIDRIFGDVVSQTGTHVPGYGFHRYVLSLSGGWTGSPVVRESMDCDLSDKDVYHFRESYKVIISRTS